MHQFSQPKGLRGCHRHRPENVEQIQWLVLYGYAVHHCWSCRRRCVQAGASSGTAGSRLTAGPGNSTPQTVGRFHCLLPLLSLASDSEKRSPHECTRTAGGAKHHMTLSQLTYNLTPTDMVRLVWIFRDSNHSRYLTEHLQEYSTGQTTSLSWCRRVTYRV